MILWPLVLRASPLPSEGNAVTFEVPHGALEKRPVAPRKPRATKEVAMQATNAAPHAVVQAPAEQEEMSL